MISKIFMLTTFTANYTKIESGYLGQLIEWQEVITEGETLDLCRESLQDALREMIAAYKQQDKSIPNGKSLLEQILRPVGKQK
jgi:predicted RNase H-like HicB family nuclease